MFGLGNSFSVKKTVKFVKETGSAVSLEKIEQEGGLSLRKQTESMGLSLQKKNVAGIRAQVVLVLDHSGSMFTDYDNGSVQKLTEKFLAFGLQVDVDGEIPVIPFDHRLHSTVNVSMSNYKTIVQDKIWRGRDMGSTKLDKALEEVLKLAKSTDAPLFVGVVTDGSPDSEAETTKLVCELSQYPVFIKFLALRSVPYLQRLDDLGNDKRLLDNVDAKFFSDLDISDGDFADAMADEWSEWVELAKKAGILS